MVSIYLKRGISIAFGLLSVPVGFLLKFMKEELCFQFGIKESNIEDEPAGVLAMKRTSLRMDNNLNRSFTVGKVDNNRKSI